MPLFKAITCLDIVRAVNSDESCLLPLHYPDKACWKTSSVWHMTLAAKVCSLNRNKSSTTLNSQLSKPSSLCKLPGNMQRNSRLIKFFQPPGPFSFSGPNVYFTSPSSSISSSSRPEHTPALRPSVFRSFEFGRWSNYFCAICRHFCVESNESARFGMLGQLQPTAHLQAQPNTFTCFPLDERQTFTFRHIKFR